MVKAISGWRQRLGWYGVLWMLLWPVLALSEPRTALVVGNASYADNPLRNPVNDARDMADTLWGLGFEVIQQENLDKRGLDQAVSDFAQMLQRRGGVGLFYYSGHGAQVQGQNYLIPVNATINSEADIEYEAVNAGRVLRNMEQAGNSLNIVVLDACRNNPYRSGFKSEGSKGLARMDAPTGSIIAYATAPGTVAADGAGRNSPYTAQLLRAIREPGLGIEQLFKKVRIEVIQATDKQQVPWESSSLTQDFFFVPPAAEVAASKPSPESPPPAALLQSSQPAAPELSPALAPVAPPRPVEPVKPAPPPITAPEPAGNNQKIGPVQPAALAPATPLPSSQGIQNLIEQVLTPTTSGDAKTGDGKDQARSTPPSVSSPPPKLPTASIKPPASPKPTPPREQPSKPVQSTPPREQPSKPVQSTPPKEQSSKPVQPSKPIADSNPSRRDSGRSRPARCEDLLLKEQVGEPLSASDRTFKQKECNQ